MKGPKFTRRDFLKTLGIAGLVAPFSKFVKLSSMSGQMNNAETPNFIVILFDALSAHHMSLYGYKRNTTPYIEKFASKSIVFHQHHAASSHTKPSTASLLTGVYPWSHRALNFYTPLLDFYNGANIFSQLDPQYYTATYTHNAFVTSILEQFATYINQLKPVEDLTVYNPNRFPNSFKNDPSVGFYAAKRWRDNYMGPSNSLFLNPIFMLTQILSSTDVQAANQELYPLGLSDNQEGYLYRLEDAIDWIGQEVTSIAKPFLGYFHLLPPHEAYRPRADFLGRFSGDGIRLLKKPPHFFTQNQTQEELEEYAQLYDEYIAFADSEFGRLCEILEQNGSLQNTYLILTADHGQMFERGIHGHGVTLYEPVIHIPLIIHAPGQSQRRDIHAATSIVDIAPTLLHLANQENPQWLEGQALPIFGGALAKEQTIFSVEAKENHRMKPLTKATLSALRWPYKLIQYRGYPHYDKINELYDLDDDPEELNNLAGSKPSVVSDLAEEIRAHQLAAEHQFIGTPID